MAKIETNSEQRLVSLTNQEIERRKQLVGLEPQDLPKIAFCRNIVLERVDELTSSFFQFLQPLPEAQPLFQRKDLLAEAKRQKRAHIAAMVCGEYGTDYVDQRIRLGTLYVTAGLEMQAFFGAFHHLLSALGTAIMSNAGSDLSLAFESFTSLRKIGFLDIGLIVHVFVTETGRIIGAQQDAIRELSTPVLQVRDRLLVLPIIGVLDSLRTKRLAEGLLHAIRERRAKVVVIDITGVAGVDSQVANHLIQTVTAAKLMGAQAIITGLSADVAQSLVALGVDLHSLNTAGDLQGGLDEAERFIGYRVAPTAGLSAAPL